MNDFKQKDDIYLLSSVNNSLRILELFAVRDTMSLKDVASALDLDRTSAFKMLYTLCYRGFLYKDEHAQYHLGNKLAPFRQLSETRNRIVDQASASIYQLWAKIHKTIMLGVMNSDEKLLVLYMKTEKNQESIYGRMGASMNIHSTGAGKVLLANLEPGIRESIIERCTLTKLTEHTITDKNEFARCIEETEKIHWGIALEENHLDHCDLAVPIYDYTGICVAVIDIVTDRQSMDENLNYYLEQLQIAGQQISQKLGYTI